MTLALADVCDLDCVASSSPLVLDMPSTERYVTGARAVAYRVLYGWVEDADLLELEGRSWSEADLAEYRTALSVIAEAEDYVLACAVEVTVVDGGALTISATLSLVDGRTYTFEVTAGDAVSVTFS